MKAEREHRIRIKSSFARKQGWAMSDELFQQTIDIFRVAVLETRDSPPVELAMREKTRRTDVAGLIEL